MGVESARRFGIKYANGKYIMHMDQDDILPSNAMHSLVQAIETENADIVVGNHERVLDKYGIVKKQIKTVSQYQVLNSDCFLQPLNT